MPSGEGQCSNLSGNEACTAPFSDELVRVSPCAATPRSPNDALSFATAQSCLFRGHAGPRKRAARVGRPCESHRLRLSIRLVAASGPTPARQTPFCFRHHPVLAAAASPALLPLYPPSLDDLWTPTPLYLLTHSHTLIPPGCCSTAPPDLSSTLPILSHYYPSPCPRTTFSPVSSLTTPSGPKTSRGQSPASSPRVPRAKLPRSVVGPIYSLMSARSWRRRPRRIPAVVYNGGLKWPLSWLAGTADGAPGRRAWHGVVVAMPSGVVLTVVQAS